MTGVRRREPVTARRRPARRPGASPRWTGAARRVPVLVLLLAAAGCSRELTVPAGAPTQVGQPPLPSTPARVGDVALTVELATTAEQRSAGLRDRDVPPGTGMAFLYPGGQQVQFTMSGVEQPLVAVFALEGRAVSVEQLVPCPGTVDTCPTYGPDTPVDVVLEAAPGSLPDARPGDPVVLDAG